MPDRVVPSLTPAGATFRIRAVAQLTGLSEQVIRAWERRYGILAPKRTPGGYRAYTEEDIAVLRRLKELTAQGVAIGDAARLVSQLRKELRAPPTKPEPTQSTGASRIDDWRGEILTATRALDQATVESALDAALAALPPLTVYEGVIVPCAREIGEEWLAGKLPVAAEHLASEVFRGRLRTLLHGAPRGGGRASVVAACLPDEQHDLGLHGAVLKLRLAGIRVVSLGMRTPIEDLATTVSALRPDQVALSAIHDPGKGLLPKELAKVRAALGPGIPILIGGRAAIAHAEAVKANGMQLIADLAALEPVISALKTR